MADVWLSAPQISSLMDWTVRHVGRLAVSESWTFRESKEVKRNGKREREFLLTSLPDTIKLKYQESIPASMQVENTAIVVSSHSITERMGRSVELVSSSLEAEFAATAPRERGILTPETLELFGERIAKRKAAIAPLIEIGKRSGRARRQQFAEMLASQAALTGNSTATLRRWVKRYAKRGDAGLAPKLREDEKESRFFSEEQNAWAGTFVIAKAVGKSDGATMGSRGVMRELAHEWTRRGETGRLPSYNTVRRYLQNKVPSHVQLLAREGKREYLLKAMPRIVRDTTGMFANDWWVMDHRIHDVEVYNTVFPHDVLEPLKMYRLWASVTWDWASKKIVGVIWAPVPSSRTITASLRMAVAQFGLPRNFLWDNGKDYRKVERLFLADDAGGILKANEVGVAAASHSLKARGVEITRALPYNPMSKVIEPYFQTLSEGIDRACGSSYCGNDPRKCSGLHKDAQLAHKAFYERKTHETPLKSDRDFILFAAQKIDEYNALGRDDLRGRSPNEVFDQEAPAESRRMVDRRVLDQLFSERDTRTVKQGGCVELNNLRYEPADDQSFAVLSAMWRPGRDSEEVMIARDAWDLGTAVAFDIQTGEFLGELQIQQTVEQTPHGRLSIDGIRAMARRKKALHKMAANYCAAIDAMAAANGWKSAFDSTLERAGVQATGTDGRPVTSEIIGRNAPGSAVGLPAPSEPRRLASQNSPFISDAAKEDAAEFAEFARPKVEAAE